MGNTNSNMSFSIEIPYATLKGRFEPLKKDECDAVSNMNLECTEIAIQMDMFRFCSMYAHTDKGVRYIRPCTAHRRCSSQDCTMSFGYHSGEYEQLFNSNCHCQDLSSENTINVTESLTFVE